MSFFNPYYSFFDSINNEVEDFNRFFNPDINTTNNKRLKTNPHHERYANQVTLGANNRRHDQVITRPTTHLDDWFDNDFSLVPFGAETGAHMAVPVDILEHDNNYVLNVTVPGVKAKKDISVEYDHNKSQLTISGEIPSTVTEVNKHNVKVKECFSGRFKRVITIPEYPDIDIDKIKADYSSGVLTLNVPKLKPKKGEKGNVKNIEITSNESWSE
ncbi:similar to Saccharomyces cerevisiae YBR072W HSP26 Small heat shock protein (sHSP) with chaperone activity [Maudiozyma saulgeensis]|uniref:Similar to Saccharomyces cerevisiae YBR072W HSP26 Small heat shock protein (SHSP) with chaperone activity n=1 Tax=Maudiozyma saulgeensis TaxID=1789683 RepID=A0A1X7R528_9SACH|nr:similar to Saccharomyces cerevisiae YBR072W HSP26 Small heat shock protein (sHSP) with chaperone activity [Kazachstania saulgeensis]